MCIENMFILHSQLEKVYHHLPYTLMGPSSKGVVLDHLVQEVNPTHIVTVVPNDSAMLHGNLFVLDLVAVTNMPPVGKVLCHNIMFGGDH